MSRDYSRRWGERWPKTNFLPVQAIDTRKHLSRAPRSAPGPDGIPYKVWFKGNIQAAHGLANLSEALATGSAPPNRLNQSWSFSYPKAQNKMTNIKAQSAHRQTYDVFH